MVLQDRLLTPWHWHVGEAALAAHVAAFGGGFALDLQSDLLEAEIVVFELRQESISDIIVTLIDLWEVVLDGTY